MGMEKVLQSIKKAEQAAEKTLSDAQSESSRILSDARRDAADMVSKAAEDAQATIKSTLDAAREAAMKNVYKSSERRFQGCLKQFKAMLQRIKMQQFLLL